MTPDEALRVLGLSSPCTIDDARVEFRARVREHHPDIAGDASTAQASLITQAYALLRRVAADGDGSSIDLDQPAARRAQEQEPAAARSTPPSAYEEAIAAELASGDTLLVHAPPAETFGVVFDAASHIGHIGYFDRNLGIVETIVRFEGGPSCSVLTTLQGRSNGTEVFCTMASIEAQPAPPIRPVVEALVDAIRASR